MKRILINAVSLALCLTVSACTPSPQIIDNEEYLDGMDYQYMYNGQPMAESPDGYYYQAGDYLYYIDKISMSAVPLCNKPNCLHQNETDPEKVVECNAYFRNNQGTGLLAWYDGHLYASEMKDPFNISEKSVIVRMDADGSNRKTVMEVEPTVKSMLIHRGYLYYSTAIYNGELAATYGIFRKSLATGKEENLFTGNEKNGSINSISAYGNVLYFDQKISDYTNNCIYLDIFGINILDKHVWKVFDTDPLVDPMMPKFLNGKIYEPVYHNQDLEDPEQHYYEHFVADLDGSNMQPVSFFSSDPTLAYRTDLDSIWYYTIPWQQTEGIPLVLQRIDESGNIMAQMKNPQYSTQAILIPGGNEHAFLVDYVDGETGKDFVLYWMEKKTNDNLLRLSECLRVPAGELYKTIVRYD